MTYPVLSVDQVRRVDSLAMEDFAMPGVILMENAGRGAAESILRHYARAARPSVAICTGAGNNGGDGFVIARHLANAGLDVRICLAIPPDKLKGDALVNYTIASKMNIEMTDVDSVTQLFSETDVIVDALLGTGFSGQVRQPLAGLIDQINNTSKPVIAIDVPSGLNADTGEPSNATITAELTVTFAANKRGFLQASAADYVGRIEVVDIGVPRAVYDMIDPA